MFHRGGENDVMAENGGGSFPPSANMPPQNMMRASSQLQEAVPISAPPTNQPVLNRANRELGLDGDDMDIPWCDLNIKERIGAGINFIPKSSDLVNERKAVILFANEIRKVLPI